MLLGEKQITSCDYQQAISKEIDQLNQIAVLHEWDNRHAKPTKAATWTARNNSSSISF